MALSSKKGRQLKKEGYRTHLSSVGSGVSDCLEPEVFLLILEKELARARRHNYFVSLLLFFVEGDLDFHLLRRLTPVLATNVRKSDVWGSIDSRSLGIILPYASSEGAPKILNRLTSEALFFLSGYPRAVRLKTSYVVYPSEVNSLDTLWELAVDRLRR